MAKDNEFVEKLQNHVEDGVIDKRSDLEIKKDELLKAIEEMEGNVIKDPKALENMKKELAKVNKQIDEEKAEKAEKEGNVVGEETTEKTEDKEVREEEKSVKDKSVSEIENEAEKESEQEPDKVDSSTEKAYEDAMDKLHSYRIEMYASMHDGEQIKRLTSTDEQFREELELEKKKAALKIRYEKGLGDKENALKEKEERLAKEERMAKEPIEKEIRERSRKYAEAMIKLHKVNLEIAYIHELMEKDKISEQDYNLRKEKALEEKTKLKDEIAKLNPKELTDAMKKESQRKDERKRVLGEDFEEKIYENASIEEKKNLDYRKKQELEQEKNIEFAEKEKIDNPKKSIEEREKHIDELRKELDRLPDDDIQRRMNILKEIEEENVYLEHEQEQKDRIDRGVVLDPKEEIKENAEIQEELKEVKQQNNEDYEKTQAAVEAIEETQGRAAVEHPEDQIMKKEETREKQEVGAIAFAAAYDNPNIPGKDTPIENLGQYAVAKCVIKGLEDKVRDPNNPEDAKAILENDKQIEEAKQELAKNEKQVLKEANR